MRTLKMGILALLGMCAGCAPQDDDDATIHLPFCDAAQVSMHARWQLVRLHLGGDSVIATLRCSTYSVRAP